MLIEFYAREAARLAGFNTVVMLNYLEQSRTFVREYAESPHHGKRRVYTYRDLVILRAINGLLMMGARPKRIQEAIATFSKVVDLPKNGDALAIFAQKSALFVVTPQGVLYRDAEALVDLSRNGQLAFAFLLDIAESIRPMANVVALYSAAVIKEASRNKAVLERVLKAANY